MFLTHLARRVAAPQVAVKHHVAIVHRWGGDSKSDWYPKVAQQLQEYNYSRHMVYDDNDCNTCTSGEGSTSVEVTVLDMPNPMCPQVDTWTQHIKDYIQMKTKENANSNQEQVFHFLGHSVGCNAVLRVASDVADRAGTKIGGIMLIAGWLSLNDPWHTAKPWCKYETGFFEKVKETIGHNVTLLVSDNDPYLYGEELEKNKEIFREEMGAMVVQINGASHFTSDKDAELVMHVAQPPQ